MTRLGKSERLYYADNAKIVAMVMIVLLHAASVYAEPFLNIFSPSSSLSSNFTERFFGVSIFLFVGFAFLMCPFFLFAGYFSAHTLESSSVRDFILDRAKRLLIPFVLFMPFVPIIRYVYISDEYFTLEGLVRFFEYVLAHPWRELILQPTYLWFLPYLFFLSVFHAVLMPSITHVAKKISTSSTPLFYLLLLCLITIGSILVKSFPSGSLFTDGYRLEYSALYVVSYFSGALLSQHQMALKNTAHPALGWTFLLVSLAGIVGVVYVFAMSPRYLNIYGLTLGNVYFSFFQACIGVGLTVALIEFSKSFLSVGNSLSRFLSAHTFGIYLFHFPIVSVLYALSSEIYFSPWIKVLAITCIALSMSLLLSYATNVCAKQFKKHL